MARQVDTFSSRDSGHTVKPSLLVHPRENVEVVEEIKKGQQETDCSLQVDQDIRPSSPSAPEAVDVSFGSECMFDIDYRVSLDFATPLSCQCPQTPLKTCHSHSKWKTSCFYCNSVFVHLVHLVSSILLVLQCTWEGLFTKKISVDEAKESYIWPTPGAEKNTCLPIDASSKIQVVEEQSSSCSEVVVEKMDRQIDTKQVMQWCNLLQSPILSKDLALDFKGKRKRQKSTDWTDDLLRNFHFFRPLPVSAFIFPVGQQSTGQNVPPETQAAPKSATPANGERPPESVAGIPWSAFRKEFHRLMTFADMPVDAPVFVLRLAQTGFLRMPDGRIVCYFCRLTHNAWNAGDVPADVHRQLSPLCPMVTGINCDNQPVPSLPEDQVLELFRIWSIQQAATPLSAFSPEQLNRGQSPQSAGSNRNVPAATNNPPGLSSLPGVHGAGVLMTASVVGNSLLPATSLSADNAGGDSSVLNGATALTSASALASTPTPLNSQPAPQSLATGQTGCSNPALQAPRGPLADGTAQPSVPVPGQEAMDSSRSGSRQGRQVVTYEQLGIFTEAPKRPDMAMMNARMASFRNWPGGSGDRPLQLAEAGFYYAGYADCGRCFFCGGGLKNWEANDNPWVEHARWFARCPFVHQCQGQDFIDIVQELNSDKTRQITMAEVQDVINRRRAAGERLQELVVDPAISSALEHGYSQAEIDEAVRQIHEEGCLLTANKLMDYLLEGAQATGGEVDSGDESEYEPGSVDQLAAENSEFRQQRMCKICLDNEVCIVFLPCGHLVSCSECSPAIKNCPMCRQKVKGRVRAFPG